MAYSRRISFSRLQAYSLFGQNRFAMIGRLRSDRRYRSQGYATELLKPVIDQLRNSPEVKWIGANTHVHNHSARRLLEKSSLQADTISYYLTLNKPEKLKDHFPGERWNEVYTIYEKRDLLLSLNENHLGLFPYECYYSFPYDEAFFTDDYLDSSKVYINHDKTRFVIIKNDTKKYDYSHVKYFWNDHYTQPGFFETILYHWDENPDNVGCWIDFSKQAYDNITDLSPYDVQEPWILYGLWT
ncbi:GNAT family N-acetyltransferase [Halobacillus campisalis]|uniref:GNAT family N-acetyltransferase n=1 Tax=Halobacillus campisalis TaxID=435909 RepID=A0ABW2K898_9BACI|nr:GNAT family N-acetyltransferase [Halobacillus campisalis]